MMTKTKRDAIVAALTDDGDAVEMDGRVWTLKFQPDDASIMDGDDGDWFGELAWDGPRNAYGWPTRPAGMDGRARKIHAARGGDAIWWQPPADVTDAEMLRTMVRQIRDILEYGYTVVVLETSDGRIAALGGVEPFADQDYMAMIVGDLAWEIALEIADDDEKRAREIAAGAMFAVVGR